MPCIKTIIRVTDSIFTCGNPSEHHILRLVQVGIIPLVAGVLSGHGLVPPLHLALRVCLQIHDEVGIFLAPEDGWGHGAAGELEVGLGVPLRGEGAVALDEAVGEDGVAVDVLDGGVAVLRLEGGEIGVVHDMVEAVCLVGLGDALDGVGDVHGVGPGVLLLDV